MTLHVDAHNNTAKTCAKHAEMQRYCSGGAALHGVVRYRLAHHLLQHSPRQNQTWVVSTCATSPLEVRHTTGRDINKCTVHSPVINKHAPVILSIAPLDRVRRFHNVAANCECASRLCVGLEGTLNNCECCATPPYPNIGKLKCAIVEAMSVHCPYLISRTSAPYASNLTTSLESTWRRYIGRKYWGNITSCYVSRLLCGHTQQALHGAREL